jgi:hypothetical protein
MPVIETSVQIVLTESVAAALDVALLSDVAGDEVTPSGVLFNVAPTVASGNALRTEAMKEDLAALLGAIAATSGNLPVVIAASPAQAAALRLWGDLNSMYTVMSSSALADRTVVVIATSALASALAAQPRFSVARAATLHMDDAATAISTPGSPNAVAAPTVNLFQSDLVGIRMTFDLDFGVRAGGSVAWIDGSTNW